MKTHILKIRSEYFKAVVRGIKTFEIRQNDRNFKKGDTVVLQEIDSFGTWTSRSCVFTIGFLLEGTGEFGLARGYAILSILDLQFNTEVKHYSFS